MVRNVLTLMHTRKLQWFAIDPEMQSFEPLSKSVKPTSGWGSRSPDGWDHLRLVQPIPADMRLLFAKVIPYCLLPNLDSVNHCTSKYLFISILISFLVQWLTESRFGKRK